MQLSAGVLEAQHADPEGCEPPGHTPAQITTAKMAAERGEVASPGLTFVSFLFLIISATHALFLTNFIYKFF